MVTSSQAEAGMTLSYTEDRPGYHRKVEQVGTFAELVRRLQEIQASRVSPLYIGVHLDDPSKNGLAIGLADDMWAVLYGDAQCTTLCYSVGDPHAQGEVELRFEQWEVLSKKWFLPVAKAVEVIQTWFETGQLSTKIPWDCRSLE